MLVYVLYVLILPAYFSNHEYELFEQYHDRTTYAHILALFCKFAVWTLLRKMLRKNIAKSLSHNGVNTS